MRFSHYTDTHINYSINSILWLINTLKETQEQAEPIDLRERAE